MNDVSSSLARLLAGSFARKRRAGSAFFRPKPPLAKFDEAGVPVA
jgi:hypothetical protein